MGHWGPPLVAKMAILAYANCLVIDQPNRKNRANFKFLFADTCVHSGYSIGPNLL